MVAKIGRGNHLKGALIYNYDKVKKDEGNIIHTHKMILPMERDFTIPLLERSFEPYLLANNKTEKPVLHISLNPSPKDRVSDELFSDLADDYMQEMGYGEQPYIVFKHTDTDRTHIHIVSVCVDENGKRISDSFEKRRSMNACRKLEKQFKLTSAIDVSEKKDIPLQKVDAKQVNVKQQITSALWFVNEQYHFQTLGEYKALLSFFNITAEELKGVIHGKEKKGLAYFATDSSGKKVSNPFKSSRFSGAFGLNSLDKKFKKSKLFIQQQKPQKRVRKLVREAMQKYQTQEDFRKHLQDNKISLFVRQNSQGRIYGVSFIDHQSKTVLNGSRLGKDLSANVFHQWSKGSTASPSIFSTKDLPTPTTETISKDTFIAEDQSFSNATTLGVLGGLLPMDVPEDNNNQILKKKRKKKRYAKRR